MDNNKNLFDKVKKIYNEKNMYARIMCGLSGVTILSYVMILMRSYTLKSDNDSQDPFMNLSGGIQVVHEVSGWFTFLLFLTISGIVLYGVKIWMDRKAYKTISGISTSIMLLTGGVVTWKALSVFWKSESVFSKSFTGRNSELLEYSNQDTFNFIMFLVIIGLLSSLSVLVLSILNLRGKEFELNCLKNNAKNFKKIPRSVKIGIMSLLSIAVLAGAGIFAYNTFVKTNVDVLEGVEVIVDKDDVSGSGSVKIDTTKIKMTDNQLLNDFKRSVSYSLSKSENLSNDDTITLTASIDKTLQEKSKVQVDKLTKDIVIKGFRTIPEKIDGIDITKYTKENEAEIKKDVCSFSCDQYSNIKVEKQSEKYVDNTKNQKSNTSAFSYSVNNGTVFYIYKLTYDYKTKDYSDYKNPKDKIETKTKFYGAIVTGITLDDENKLYNSKNDVKVEQTYSGYETVEDVKSYLSKNYNVEM